MQKINKCNDPYAKHMIQKVRVCLQIYQVVSKQNKLLLLASGESGSLVQCKSIEFYLEEIKFINKQNSSCSVHTKSSADSMLCAVTGMEQSQIGRKHGGVGMTTSQYFRRKWIYGRTCFSNSTSLAYIEHLKRTSWQIKHDEVVVIKHRMHNKFQETCHATTAAITFAVFIFIILTLRHFLWEQI